jgi:phosphoribosylaminoimidazole-succinocarboxamide synthase
VDTTNEPAVYEGKAKRVRLRGDGLVELQFKDDATAFNGQRHERFAGKGPLNSEISELLFAYLAQRGVKSHARGRLDERTLLAERAVMIPLEVVVRFQVAGSLRKRTGLPDGTLCEPPIVEFYYKSDALGDPLLTEEHIRLLGLATEAELKELAAQARRAALLLRMLCERARLCLYDLKFEFGRTAQGLVLADEISPDTCRFRDAQTGESLDKDVFREGRGELLRGYRIVYDRLRAALAPA